MQLSIIYALRSAGTGPAGRPARPEHIVVVFVLTPGIQRVGRMSAWWPTPAALEEGW